MGNDWEKQFWELYKDKNLKIFDKALELKRNHIPPKLYRYRSLRKIEDVKNEIILGNVYLAAPCEFNDLYDSCSVLFSKQITDYMQYERMKDLYKHQFKGTMDKNIFNNIFNSDDWVKRLFRYVINNIAEESDHDEEFVSKALNQCMMSGYEALNETCNKMSSRMNRIACFTTEYANLPMWAHYANQHSGICIEYNTQHIQSPLILNRLFPVIYTTKIKDMIKFMIDNMNDDMAMFHFLDYMAAQKLTDWQYEKEWRLILNLGHLYFSLEDVPQDKMERGQLYHFAIPSKVILGCRISENNEREIKKVCDLKDIPVVKMEATSYGLKYNE